MNSSGGNIKLYIPENAKATISARIRLQGNDWGWSGNRHRGSDEYSVRSEFKSETYEKDTDGREIRAKYILNGGGQLISLETVNGDIDILKLSKRSKE